MESIVAIPILLICLALTTIFATANLALRHVSWSQLEDMFTDRGHPRRAERMRERLDHLLAGTATLRMLFNLILLIVLTLYLLPDRPHTPGDLLVPLLQAFLIAAALLLLCAVALAQAWARAAGTSFLVFLFPLLELFLRLVSPLTWLVQRLEPPVRRVANLTRSRRHEPTNGKHEELLNAVEEGRKEGFVDAEEEEMITSVLEFRRTTVGEIMTPRTEIVGLPVDIDFGAAVQTIIREGHSRYPVFEGSIDHVVGMLYAKDLLKDLHRSDDTIGICHRFRDAYFIPENKSLRDLLHDFQNQKLHAAVVLDEYGGTAGLVTLEDILEELVGELSDEYEQIEEKPLHQVNEHTWELDARCNVEELNSDLDLHLPTSDGYETIGGFLSAELGHIPRTDEEYHFQNLAFLVLDAGPRKVNRIRLTVLAPADRDREDR